jgi:hypothetical protein
MWRPRLDFDPILIILEICALQFSFYFANFLVVIILDTVSSVPFTSHQILNYAIMRIDSHLGRAAVAGLFSGGLAIAYLFSILVARWRAALDFITTAFGLHLVVISISAYFPKSYTWWLSFVCSWAVSEMLAEYFSLRSELQDINLDMDVPAYHERSKDGA